MDSKNQVAVFSDTISIALLAVLLFFFPLIISNQTTDFLILPKQILLAAVVGIGIVLFCVKILSLGKVVFRKTPFDLAVAFVLISAVISSLLAVNRLDSLMNVVPFVFAAASFWLITNTVKSRIAFSTIVFSFLGGAAVCAVISALSFFEIYILPFDFVKTRGFTPLGSTLDSAIYLGTALLMALFFLLRERNFTFLRGVVKTPNPRDDVLSAPGTSPTPSQDTLTPILLGAIVLITLGGFAVSVISLFTFQKPTLLPFETGFQTSFAAISQDAGRTLQGFISGAGFGNYATVFTRFKQPTFNQYENLWTLTFFRSSSFVLELLATTGILGLLSFLYLVFKIVRKAGAFLPLIGLSIAGFLLPFSFVDQALIFFALGIFCAYQGARRSHPEYFDVALKFVTLREGILSFAQPTGKSQGDRILPVIISLLLVLTTGTLAYYSYLYVSSDITFQKSVVASSRNQANGGEVYELQSKAINTFPYRDGYFRIFSQTNLAIANSLASNQPQNASPSAQDQQTILRLIQDSVTSGRIATQLAPQTASNWQNFASVYRALIGVGQNAEGFAIDSQQRAVILDPNNPQQYVILGGIYYQLARWDEAQRQFQIAVNLKPDFANARYNLAHTLREKGDLQNALSQLQIVRTLVEEDEENRKKVDQDIAALQSQIQEEGTQAQTPSQEAPQAEGEQPPLSISTPSAQLPPVEPKVEIPAPNEEESTPAAEE